MKRCSLLTYIYDIHGNRMSYLLSEEFPIDGECILNNCGEIISIDEYQGYRTLPYHE